MKLRKTQVDILEAMNVEGEKLHYMPYMGRFRENPYYFYLVKRGRKPRKDVVSKLEDMGLLKNINKGKWKDAILVISDEGRKALEDSKK